MLDPGVNIFDGGCEDVFLTTEEAAHMLKTTKASIDNLCSRRKLTYFRLTKRRLFRKTTLIREVMNCGIQTVSYA